jgi:hypothetical protein
MQTKKAFTVEYCARCLAALFRNPIEGFSKSSAMKKHRRKNTKEEMPVSGKPAGRRLLHYTNRYGEQKIRTAIAEIRKTIPSEFKDHEPYTRTISAEDTLERMYRDYVAASSNPILTFVEYKALVDIIAERM